MNVPKSTVPSQKAISKLLDDIIQYAPPVSIGRDAYAGNKLEQGELIGTIDGSMRESKLVHLQIPEKNYQITLSVEHFPVLQEVQDGTMVKATVNEFGFISEVLLAEQA
jgi:hypothetical protein